MILLVSRMDSLKNYGSDSDSCDESEEQITEDAIHKLHEVTTHKLPERTTHKLPEVTTHKLPEVTTYKLPERTTHKLPEVTTHKLPERTTHKLLERTTHKLPEVTTHKLPEGTTHKLPEGTIHKLPVGATCKTPEGKTHMLPEETVQNLTDEIQSKIIYSTPDKKQNVHRKVIDSPEKSDTLSFNFLGLEKQNNIKSYTFSGSQTLGDQTESRKVQTNWGEVEVPNSDFWTDFQPDCASISPTQKCDNSEYHKTQTDKIVVSKMCVTGANSHFLQPHNSMQSQNILQSQHSPCSQNSLQLHSSLKRVHHCKSSSTNAEVSDSYNKHARISDQSLGLSYNHLHPAYDQLQQTPEGLPYPSKEKHNQQNLHEKLHNNFLQSQPIANEKRKVFYIHSKVAPYVNTTPTNKCASRRLNTWPAHDGVINRLAWNVPSFSHLLVTAGMDTSVKVWNVWSSLDLCVARLSSHRKAIKHVEWCQTGRKVLSCSYDRTAQVTDVETAKVLGKYEHMGFVTAGHIHPSNPNMFVTGTDNLIVKWDMRTPQAPVKHFCYKDRFGQVQDLLFINNGQEFVSCSDLVSRDCADRTVMVWDLRAGTVLSNQIYQELYVCTRLKTHPNSSSFLAQSHAGYVALFSATSPYKMDKSKRYEGHKIEGHSIGFDISPDGAFVYSGSAGNDLHCYHQNSSRLLRKLSSKNDIITDVACHPVLPSCLASCTWGGSVSLWM